MVDAGVPEVDYTDYSNLQLAAVPLAVLAVALCILGGWYLATGAPATLGIEFTGGVELHVTAENMDEREARQELREAFSVEPSSIRSFEGDDRLVVTFRADDVPDEDALDEVAGEAESAGFSVERNDVISPSFASDTQFTALGGIAIAFTGMAVLVFALFRTFVPSVAVVASAFSDLVVPVAAMNLLGIEMTLGTVAALLMLIGYSVDSDILLNNSVLRQTGGFYESVRRATRTGITMTITSIAAMIVMAIAATFFGIDILRDIGIILTVGLFADLMNTYLMNVSLLRWYKFEGVRG